jgi:hypothetical protein
MTMTCEKLEVVAIIDTRSRDEHGFIIPGSGDARPCDICSRCIYIHVNLRDGRIIGRECLKKATGRSTVAARPQWTITVTATESGRFAATYSNGKVESWRGASIEEVRNALRKQWPCDVVA